MSKTNIEVPEGLYLFDPESAVSKLGRFMSSGAGLRGVLDFDLTLTTGGNSWDPIYAVLPESGQTAMNSMRRRYVPQVAAGRLSLRDSVVWSGVTFNLCAARRPSLEDIAEHTRQIPIRPGAIRLLNALSEAGAFTEIHSAGPANVIRERLRDCGVIPLPHLVSTELEVTDGRVTGWRQSTFVHVANKADWGRIRHEATKEQYPISFVIGDGPHDIHMSPQGENTFGIMVCDFPKPGKGDLEEILAIGQRAGFDAAVIGSLDPAAQLFMNISACQASLGRLALPTSTA